MLAPDWSFRLVSSFFCISYIVLYSGLIYARAIARYASAFFGVAMRELLAVHIAATERGALQVQPACLALCVRNQQPRKSIRYTVDSASFAFISEGDALLQLTVWLCSSMTALILLASEPQW